MARGTQALCIMHHVLLPAKALMARGVTATILPQASCLEFVSANQSERIPFPFFFFD
jgi:hypothetical protein